MWDSGQLTADTNAREDEGAEWTELAALLEPQEKQPPPAKAQGASANVGSQKQNALPAATPYKTSDNSSKKSSEAFAIGILSLFVLFIGGCIYHQLNPQTEPVIPPTAEELKYGTAPQFIGSDYCRPVNDYLKSHLRDPDSLEIIQYFEPKAITEDGIDGWGVKVRYRAKNGFGGYTIEEGVALVRYNQVQKFISVPR